jgi:hypothetical protein
MKKKHIMTLAAVLTALVVAGGATSTVLAAGNNSSSAVGIFFDKNNGQDNQQGKQQMTDTQKEEMKTKTEAIQTAIDDEDYDAWVAAVEAVNENSPLLSKITSDNFDDYVEASQLVEKANSIFKDLGVNGVNIGMGGGQPGGHGPNGASPINK